VEVRPTLTATCRLEGRGRLNTAQTLGPTACGASRFDYRLFTANDLGSTGIAGLSPETRDLQSTCWTMRFGSSRRRLVTSIGNPLVAGSSPARPTTKDLVRADLWPLGRLGRTDYVRGAYAGGRSPVREPFGAPVIMAAMDSRRYVSSGEFFRTRRVARSPNLCDPSFIRCIEVRRRGPT
jgi:hypothetical protein